MERLQMDISGMSCGHCVGAVRRALDGVAGVSITSVSVGSAEVAYDAAKAEETAILAAVSDAGFPARATGGAS